MESTDQILALGQIHAGLAADAGVHHREQAGRKHRPRDSPQISGRRKPGQVSNHAAAQPDHGALPFQPTRQQPIPDTPNRSDGFVFLSGRDHDSVDREAAVLKRCPNLPQIVTAHLLIRHQSNGRGKLPRLEYFTGQAQAAWLYPDVVPAVCRVHPAHMVHP